MKKLQKYVAKRRLKSTPEPQGGKTSAALPHFCIQKHDASHLHYDFRLEYKGVLLSWAVPKGPSLDPRDKRLAIRVEDHPLDYQYFEGVIPKGNYGAGTVEIWDHGIFTTSAANTPKEIEKALKDGLKKGHFNVILQGERLNGEFIFQKLKEDQVDNSWLLIKKKALKLPKFFSPMLAQLIDEPFDHDEWLFEIKWDGYRTLAFIEDGQVKLYSRNNHLLNESYPLIVQDLKVIKNQMILDGEIVVLDEAGKSSFQDLQNYQKNSNARLCYYVFDLLFKDGEDLRDEPLITRKELLKKHLPELSHVKYCDHIFKKGTAFFEEALKNHLEGIIGKKINSTYQSKRSPNWVKIKTTLRQEVVIGGFTTPKGSRKNFGALLIGLYNKEHNLEYVGHVGGGFNDLSLNTIYKQLTPLIQKKCPFSKEPDPNTPATWVKPKLMCEVSFTEWTKDHSMRHPIFQGMKNSSPKDNKLELTHLEKVYWPEEGYTKGDLLAYYEKVAHLILPYLKDRPIMLHRYPDGIEGKSFYQKDLPPSHPEWLKTCEIEQEQKLNHYLVINDLDSLLYAVNLGSIDLHPFSSRAKNLNHPDYCIIDLDPHDILFDKVIEAVLVVHEILESFKVPNFCKTSGGKGMHILIPLGAKYTYEQSRQFAEIIGTLVHEKLPKTTSLERSPAKRPKKIYIDCLQNRISQGIVAPYSVRPRPHALVSTPLKWEEVKKGLIPNQFDIKTVLPRFKKLGDIFPPVLKAGINLKKVFRV